MRILLTNDDGIRAPGIVALHDALLGLDNQGSQPIGGADTEIVTIAPETVQSATSHGVTFDQPLMAKPTIVNDRMRGIAVDGRPADCVKIALSCIWPERYGEGAQPDLVVSGMNSGANCGINVIYSGTVAAALEASFLGVPSIAVSMHLGRGKPLFDVAARHARRAIDLILESGLIEPGMCINIKVPRTEVPWGPDEVGNPAPPPVRQVDDPPPESIDPYADPPIRVCAMNTHGLIDEYQRRVNPNGDVYYWASGGGLNFHGCDDDTDVQHLFEWCTTITPLHHDLTHRESLGRWVDAIDDRRAGQG